MERAPEIRTKVAGVNNRNCHDFSVGMGTTSGLVDMVRDRYVFLCALVGSGIKGPEDVRVSQNQGVHVVLAGEW